jgi:hypothetical protein
LPKQFGVPSLERKDEPRDFGTLDEPILVSENAQNAKRLAISRVADPEAITAGYVPTSRACLHCLPSEWVLSKESDRTFYVVEDVIEGSWIDGQIVIA